MTAGNRRLYIDWARGLAVLVMIEAHTFDAWTRLADRSTPTYRNFMIVGGLAAPLFLWLAGFGAAFSAESALRRTGNRRSAAAVVCKRGLEIFILAFLFRLQAFVVSPGNALISLFRVDILNVMGPSIIAVGLVWLACRGRAVLVIALSALAMSVSMTTPLVRVATWVSVLPVGLQWYLRPMGEHTVFTLFPWAGFVLGGAAVGILLNGLSREREHLIHLVLAPVGAGLVALGLYAASLPSIYRESSFWTTSPTYFVVRLGIMTFVLSAAYGFERICSRWGLALRPLARLGRASLFIYWIHVELVYGYATWPLRRRLPLPYTVAAYLGFCLLMYGAVVLRDRFATRETRTSLDSPSRAVQA